jgi:hypothetical protein
MLDAYMSRESRHTGFAHIIAFLGPIGGGAHVILHVLFDSTGGERGPKVKVCQRLAGRGQDSSQGRVACHAACPLQLDGFPSEIR